MQAHSNNKTRGGIQHNNRCVGRMHAPVDPACHSQRQRTRVTQPRSCTASVDLQLSQHACPDSSSTSSSTGLASYPLLDRAVAPSSQQHSWSQMWFEAMVQTVVKQLDGSPFLLRVTARPFLQIQLVRLDISELDQGWEHIQQRHLSATGAADDAVILVHPVISEQQPCAVQQVRGSACANCPVGQAGCSYDEGQAPELLAGRFGDCCSGDEQQQQQSATSSSTKHQCSSSNHSTQSTLAFYGLVVQCRDPADSLQGCYLLKTMQLRQHHGGGSGCHCTHYSLNRVCKGPSLRQQYQDAWLV